MIKIRNRGSPTSIKNGTTSRRTARIIYVIQNRESGVRVATLNMKNSLYNEFINRKYTFAIY